MQFFFGVIIFLLVVLAFAVIIVLRFIQKGVNKFRRAMTGDLDDEEVFQRMANKHYRQKDDPQFDKDYFKSSGSSKTKQKQSQSRYRTTTTTNEGVTIIDDRPVEERRKIFEQEEGEYVEYTEVKD
jgi:hypothetical protein